jgi:thiamine kinase-like enzyme
MNPSHIATLCDEFNLGFITGEASQVHGGLLHQMWRIDTKEGCFAVKQLSPNIDLKKKNIVDNYELTETIAERFKQLGIPVVSAIQRRDKHLIIIDQTGYLIYPWVEARALNVDEVTEVHQSIIAKILARIHSINLSVPELDQAQFDIHSNESIVALIDKAESCHCPFSGRLRSLLPDIVKMNDRYQSTIPLLKENVVVSHGDLDPKNVLWDKKDQPIIIDWESARKLNPTYEILNASLDWSGITSGNFDESRVDLMLHAYKKENGLIDTNHLHAAHYAVIGNWLNWMVYNIERACSDDSLEQREMGVDQVNQVLRTLDRVKTIILTEKKE